MALANVTFNEVFNRESLETIVKYKNYFKKYFNGSDCDIEGKFSILKKYLEMEKNGSVPVEYFKKYGKGRQYATKSLSLQSFPRDIRGTISKDYYIDVDMVNAHPNIIVIMMLKKFNHKLPALTTYNENRDSVINEILSTNLLNYDDVKTAILSVIYGGHKNFENIKNKTPWMIEFKNEIEELHKKIQSFFPEEYKFRKSKKEEGCFNLEGSTLSSEVCVIENELLECMVKYLKRKGFITDCAVLCFDGIMIPKTNLTKPEEIKTLIRDIEDRFEEMEYPLKLKVKEFSEIDIRVPDNIVDDMKLSDKKSLFDFNDEYCWFDFIEILKSKFWEEHELFDFVKQNINRVIIRTLPEEYFIKSYSGEFMPIDKIPGDIINWNEVVSAGPSGIVKAERFEPFRKLLNRKLFNFIKTHSKIEFDPRGISNKGCFNVWSGFKAKKLEQYDVSKIQPILNHIKIVWANNNEEHYHYIMSWFHNIFKYPYRKTRIVIVLRSEKQQIGKGAIVENFLNPYVFGSNISLYGVGLDFLTTRFNFELANKIFVSVDELPSISVGDYHSSFDIIKSKITSDVVKVEIKGGSKFDIKNYMNIIMMTNNQYSVKVEEGDARYAIFNCSNEMYKKSDYFDSLFKNFNDETGSIFFSYIYDLENPCDIKQIPETQIKKDITLSSMSSTRRYMHYCKDTLSNYVISDDNESWKNRLLESDKEIKSNSFYEIYKSFCLLENEKPVSNNKFGREVQEIIPKKRTNKGYVYDLNSINLN